MRKLEQARQRGKYASGREPDATVDADNAGIFTSNDQPPSKSTTLLVLGSGRGGTSLVAGILYHMGIFMGDECVKPSYEDNKLIREMRGSPLRTSRETIQDYSSRFDVWGFKQPMALRFIMRHHELFSNPRLIVVVKDAAAIAVRKVFVLGGDPLEYMNRALNDYKRILRFVSRSKLPTLIVSYEKLMADPERFIDAAVEFSGIDIASQAREAALDFVRKGNEEYQEFSLAKRNRRTSTFCSYLDIVSTHRIAGWVVNLQSPDPVVVVLRIGGVEISKMLADLLRSDVRDAGFHPTGYCGFEFNLSEEAQFEPGTLVRVLVGDGSIEVAGSPKEMVG